MNHPATLAVSVGDPAGVGLEVALKAAKLFPEENFIFVGPENLIHSAAKRFATARFTVEDAGDCPEHLLFCGKNSPECGEASHRAVVKAIELVRANKADALVTAPISKAAWHAAGHTDPGHTDLIEKLTGNRTVMAFQGEESSGQILRTALATIHVPLRKVPDLITAESLTDAIDIILRDLKRFFGMSQPEIGLCGLNPHAGESGLLGTEESNVIRPVVEAFAAKGDRISGPWPADAIFQKHMRSRFDLILGMYHDQVLAPFKALCPRTGVNITFGTGLIRTSPDHGTAFDIAGAGKADPTSMQKAIETAITMVRATGKTSAGIHDR